MGLKENEINQIIQDEKLDTNKISDGYHTFGELYDHRIALFIALCNIGHDWKDSGEKHSFEAWKSKLHHDGTMFAGWYIAGIREGKGEQISYHLPMSTWDKLQVPERERAPEWDGHTPADVVKRLGEL
jgi:hypothetical protein